LSTADKIALLALVATLLGMFTACVWMVSSINTKVNMLYDFWEKKMERRSLEDQQRSERGSK